MTASPRIYTRSLHDALPIWVRGLEQRHDVLRQLEEAHSSGREKLFAALAAAGVGEPSLLTDRLQPPAGWERSLDFYFAADRKSTRLNSSHGYISITGFCLIK